MQSASKAARYSWCSDRSGSARTIRADVGRSIVDEMATGYDTCYPPWLCSKALDALVAGRSYLDFRSTHIESISEQQDDSAEHGEQQAANVEAGDASQAEGRTEVAAQHRSCDADQNR